MSLALRNTALYLRPAAAPTAQRRRLLMMLAALLSFWRK